MIPLDELYEGMLTELASLDHEKKENLQLKMESLGFETTWALPNLGSLPIFFM